MKFFCGERASGGNVSETDEGVHQRKLSRMVELQARDTFATGRDCRLDQFL